MDKNDMSLQEIRSYDSESVDKIRNNCTIQIARLFTIIEENKNDISRLQLIRARCVKALEERKQIAP